MGVRTMQDAARDAGASDATDTGSSPEAICTDELGLRARGLVDQLPDAVLSVDLAGRVVAANPAAVALLPGRLATLLGTRLRELFGDDHADAAERGLRSAMQGRVERIDTEIVSSGGAQVTIGLVCVPIRHDGNVIGVECLLRDSQPPPATTSGCSHHAAQARLRELEALKADLLQGLNHELRTPLTIVMGFASTLRRHHTALPIEEVGAMLWRIERAAQQVHGRLEDIEALVPDGRLARPRVPRPEPVDLADVVRACVGDEQLVQGRSIVTDLASMPARVDPALVGRAVEHLVRNAVRHTPVGTTVWIRIVDGGVVVEDDGPGVAEGQRAGLFDPFTQGDDPRRAPSPGTGIGLAFAAHVARVHGGTLAYRDRPGGGAAFHLCLGAPAVG